MHLIIFQIRKWNIYYFLGTFLCNNRCSKVWQSLYFTFASIPEGGITKEAKSGELFVKRLHISREKHIWQSLRAMKRFSPPRQVNTCLTNKSKPYKQRKYTYVIREWVRGWGHREKHLKHEQIIICNKTCSNGLKLNSCIEEHQT